MPSQLPELPLEVLSQRFKQFAFHVSQQASRLLTMTNEGQRGERSDPQADLLPGLPFPSIRAHRCRSW